MDGGQTGKGTGLARVHITWRDPNSSRSIAGRDPQVESLGHSQRGDSALPKLMLRIGDRGPGRAWRASSRTANALDGLL